eukprot:1167962_1
MTSSYSPNPETSISSVNCIRIDSVSPYPSYACIEHSFHVPSYSDIHCSFDGCFTDHTNVSPVLDYCDQCVSPNCVADKQLQLNCTDGNSEYSIFYGHVQLCSGDICTYHDSQIIPNIPLSMLLVGYGLCFISILMTIRILIYWILHRRSTKIFRTHKIPLKPPYCILATVHMANALICATVWYGVIYVALLHKNMIMYCQSHSTRQSCEE